MKRKHDDYLFDGQIVADFLNTKGRQMYVVEQHDTGVLRVFYDNQIFVDDGFGWVDAPSVVRVPVASPVVLPYEVFLPVRPILSPGQQKRERREIVRNGYLKPLPRHLLCTGKVRAEVEFHFPDFQVGDLDNLLKPTFDMLKGSVIVDDKQIQEIWTKGVEKSERGEGVLIRLYSLEV